MRSRTTPADVATLATEFAAWRRSKRHARERVPAPLLKKALAAARTHTVGAVARALKIDRRKLRAAGEARREVKEAEVVRLAPVTLLPAPTPGSAIVEIEDPSGWRLRIAGGDTHAAVRAFVEARR